MRNEVIFAGFGGQGVVKAAWLLSKASTWIRTIGRGLPLAVFAHHVKDNREKLTCTVSHSYPARGSVPK
jgi:hypothetical protein